MPKSSSERSTTVIEGIADAEQMLEHRELGEWRPQLGFTIVTRGAKTYALCGPPASESCASMLREGVKCLEQF